MKKSALSIIMLLVMLGWAMPIFNIQPSKAYSIIVYVDDDNVSGPWDGSSQHPYRNITSGLEHTSPNGTIFVYNGTYCERIHVNESISLIGENKHGTIIDGNFTGTVLRITAGNVNVINFTICNGESIEVGGVDLRYCVGCHINDNIIRDNQGDGIGLENSSNNIMADNFISCPPLQGTPLVWIGIYSISSNENVIANNTISSAYVALYLSCSDQNAVSDNRLFSNWYGIRIHGSSDNTIFTNEVFNNKRGIHIGYYAPELGILNNRIYHNDFINNTQQATKTNSINIWDNGYPSGGNFWSDYNGTDVYSGPYQNETGSDRIGDTPYIIPDARPAPEDQDSYPLMKPLFWWNLADVNYDLKVDLYDAVSVLAAYGSKLGDEEYNPHCDIAEPYGKIDLYDAVLVLVNYGKKYT